MKIRSKLFILWVLAVSGLLICAASAEEISSGVHLIYTVSDLRAIARDPGGRYQLMNDIDLAGEDWLPIPFSGVLDGGGHGLYNLTIRRTGIETSPGRDGNLKEYSLQLAGFFSEMNNAAVMNLGITGADVSIEADAHCFAAILCGKADHSTVTNVSVRGRVSLINHGIMTGVGGIAGYGNGSFEQCTVLAQLTLEDRQFQQRCEQFMGGILACGIGNVSGCAVDLSGYDSCHGYVHNGGLIGMYYHCGQEVSSGKIMHNTVTGSIHFFEDNRDRRAYCEAVIGEKLTKPVKMSDNLTRFTRDETRKTDTVLQAEKCDTPAMEETVIQPENGHWGWTLHRCTGCGNTWSDQYTPPAYSEEGN